MVLKNINIFFVMVLLLVGTSGCGKKAPLKAPSGEPSTYPMSYPRY